MSSDIRVTIVIVTLWAAFLAAILYFARYGYGQ